MLEQDPNNAACKPLGWWTLLNRVLSPGKNVPYIDGVAEFKKALCDPSRSHPGLNKTLFIVFFWSPRMAAECPSTRSWFIKMLFSSSKKGMGLRKKLSLIYRNSDHGLVKTEND